MEKTFTLKQALILLLVSLALFVGLGFLVGKVFFWVKPQNSQTSTKLDYLKKMATAKPQDPVSRFNLGYGYFLEGNFVKAKTEFEEAYWLNPRFFNAVYYLGVLHKEHHYYEEALIYLEKAGALAPSDYRVYLQKGIVYGERGKYKEAVKAFNEANKLRPGAADVLYYSGVFIEKSGDRQGAVDFYGRALACDPQFEEAKKALQRLAMVDGPKRR